MEGSAVIEVTDGWYGIRALLDRALTRLLHDRKIVVGQKLIVYGPISSVTYHSILYQAPSSLMLRLHANSTRRARWDVKLGFHSHTHAFPLPLASLFGDGGFTGCVDVIVLRQYPVQWMEKMSDGSNVFRNSRLEEREAKKFEADRQQRREKLFLKIQDEFEKDCQHPDTERRRSARFRRRSFSSRDLKDLHDGKEIYEALTQASDPDAVKECLDERQLRALEEYRRLSQERKFAELQSKFERVWKEQEEDHQLQRNVVPLLKVRIADYLCQGQARQNAVLSIWRPSEEVMHLLSEGSRLRIYHLTAAGVRFRQGASELQDRPSDEINHRALLDVKSLLCGVVVVSFSDCWARNAACQFTRGTKKLYVSRFLLHWQRVNHRQFTLSKYRVHVHPTSDTMPCLLKKIT
ncbi:Breast cancer 2, early onset [Desmophyllum pertusum]|uniref:Breast cancer 2, early onset n=1 Tax=Desmophyllum pertusum TaxID=174260 RepID=A0A9X0CQ79_9CNID|nr:Breast cancer 2, early onset [Desmophyllum pertusum]